ncbi:MAG: hypothetical protein RLZZ312_1554 [Bacteroidota bacterium]|jgi:hypothetical protein
MLKLLQFLTTKKRINIQNVNALSIILTITKNEQCQFLFLFAKQAVN